MMIPNRLMMTCAAFALFCACSTTQVSEEAATNVPPKRFYQSSFVTTGETPAQLTFVRDKGLTGGACKVILYVNGQRAFLMGRAEKATVEVDPGEYVLRLEWGADNYCPNEYQTKEVSVKAGEQRKYRFSMSSNFNIGFTREL